MNKAQIARCQPKIINFDALSSADASIMKSSQRIWRFNLNYEDAAQAWVRGTIRSEMARLEIGYADLARRLTDLGVEISERALSNKIARGTFSASFFALCLEALAVNYLKVDLLERSVGAETAAKMKLKFAGERDLEALRRPMLEARGHNPEMDDVLEKIREIIADDRKSRR